MAWRERLLRFGATAAAIANARRVRIAAQLLVAGGLIFVLLRLHSIWHDSHISLTRIAWLSLVGAFALTAVGIGASGYIWLLILRWLGVRTRPRWAGIFFQAQLAKYIPGTLWQYAGRAALARAHGIPLRAVGISLPTELGSSLVAAAALSSLLLGGWGIPLATVVLGAGVLAGRRLGSDSTVNSWQAGLRAGTAAAPLFAAAWLVIGSGFWLTARALVGVPVGDLLLYIGAFSAAWVVGVVAVYAPGGIGVREAMLVAILHGRIGSADALVVAAASRIMMALIDLCAAALGAMLLRGDRSVSVSTSHGGGLPPDAPTGSTAR
jgi:uncharacterized membrane protein YbhN (UPF0104 family)